MAEHPINGLMETAMQSIRDMVDVNTIVGEPVESKDGTVIIPISKVSFGFGAGGSEFGKKDSECDKSGANFGGGSGGGASIEPVAFMVVGNEQIKLMPIEKNTSPVEDIIDSVPTLVDKVIKALKKKKPKADKTEEKQADAAKTVETV